MPDQSDAQHSLDVLLALTKRLTDERSLQRALACVTDAALELLPGTHASVRVLDRSRTELLSGARSGAGRDASPVRHEAGKGIAGWVVQNAKLARVDDARDDERFINIPNQGFEIRSILAVPLLSLGESIGVLAITDHAPNVYRERHESLACLLANCAVPLLEKARLRRLAITDTSTMAYNQAYLIPGLRAEMERARGTATLSLMLMDLDHFKAVNDAHGHPAGDRVLRVFADTIRGNTRTGDLVVRRGGDEFVLIMPRASADAAATVAERIRSAMENEPVRIDAQITVSITTSIGIAVWNNSESPEALERRADEAMYRAKDKGRNRVELACVEPASKK